MEKCTCQELKIPVIGTHGLRHSTSVMYLNHGASQEDLRVLFAHSSSSITERYTHGAGGGLKKITNLIRLFQDEKVSKKFPTTSLNGVDESLSFQKVSMKGQNSGSLNMTSCGK